MLAPSSPFPAPKHPQSVLTTTTDGFIALTGSGPGSFQQQQQQATPNLSSTSTGGGGFGGASSGGPSSRGSGASPTAVVSAADPFDPFDLASFTPKGGTETFGGRGGGGGDGGIGGRAGGTGADHGGGGVGENGRGGKLGGVAAAAVTRPRSGKGRNFARQSSGTPAQRGGGSNKLDRGIAGGAGQGEQRRASRYGLFFARSVDF